MGNWTSKEDLQQNVYKGKWRFKRKHGKAVKLHKLLGVHWYHIYHPFNIDSSFNKDLLCVFCARGSKVAKLMFWDGSLKLGYTPWKNIVDKMILKNGKTIFEFKKSIEVVMSELLERSTFVIIVRKLNSFANQPIRIC